jgi:hypothetical protein
MITNKDERIGHPQWTEAGGQGDLRSFIDYAIIEFSAKEERARY